MAFQPRNIGTHKPHEPVVLPPAAPSLIVPPNHEDIFRDDEPDCLPREDTIEQAVIDAGTQPLALLRRLQSESDVFDALSSAGVFNDLTAVAIVLGKARLTTLEERADFGSTNGSAFSAFIPRWWCAFCTTDGTRDHLFRVLCALRAHGVDMQGTPYNEHGGGEHGEALRAFLGAERAEAEQATLHQAAAWIDRDCPHYVQGPIDAPARRRARL
ncbi:hypothetical protein KDX26_19380 [Burkholderia cenocepacia]|uniref:hypothetical protein n=1 Tax=Burkholderia cenocepacia TaxID=95486 RepID=UPI001B98C78E|nr:hypothetical protein [Burkholderia cenocepacia]MBR8384562.1 hypothetical protein [Burkholderia cenocepacia]